MLQLTVRDALNSALDEEMENDTDVFILGEEVSGPPSHRICQEWANIIYVFVYVFAMVKYTVSNIPRTYAGWRVPGCIQGKTACKRQSTSIAHHRRKHT